MAESGIFNPPPFYKRAGFVRFAIIFLLIGTFIFLFRAEIGNTWEQLWRPTWPLTNDVIQSVLILAWNSLLFIGSFIIILLLVSQYTLPLQNDQQRKRVFDRLFSFLTGQHGPAVFIKEGEEIAKESELLSAKPGVAFIDLTSALALEKQSPPKATPTATRISTAEFESTSPFSPSHIFESSRRKSRKGDFVRIAGPGITFTEAGEKIRGVIDLRPQIRFRRSVHAYTRDGIEIETSITTIFTIAQPPEMVKVVYKGEETAENIRTIILKERVSGGDVTSATGKGQVIEQLLDVLDLSEKEEIHRFIKEYRRTGVPSKFPRYKPISDPTSPFIFDPGRIFAAIYASSLDVKEDDYMEWTELPPFLATEMFRNLIGREIYDYLYFPSDPRKFPLQDLKSNFAVKMRYQGVLAYQFVERKNNIPFEAGQDWLENQNINYPAQVLRTPKVLRARGIKVIHASFSDLTPVNPGVRGQLLDNWSAYWESEAEQTLVEYEIDKIRIINDARIQAQISLKDTLKDLLQSSSLADDALALRMLQALEGVAADPATRKFLPRETINMLNSIWKWLLTKEQYQQLQSGMYPGVQTGTKTGAVIPGSGTISGEIEEVIGEAVEEGTENENNQESDAIQDPVNDEVPQVKENPNGEVEEKQQ